LRPKARALLLDIRAVVRAGAPATERAPDEWALDSDLLDLVRAARAAAVPVALTAGGAESLPGPGLAEEFDAVVESSTAGRHKPSAEFFADACAALVTPPSACLFVDTDDRHIRGARAAGLPAHRWTGPADLPYLRAALDLPRNDS